MAIFGGATGAVTVTVECPHCYEVQLRARAAAKAGSLRCRKCKRAFTLAAGQERYANSQAAKRGR